MPALAELAVLDDAGRPVIEADFRVRLRPGCAAGDRALFVQNAELHAHGVGAPDLGLGAHRNAVIVNALCGREVYPVRERNVFQTFGAPAGAAARRRAAVRRRDPRGMTGALVDALTRERWEQVNRELIAKLLTELAYEDVLAPAFEELADGRRAFALALGERLVLRYEGHRRPLGDWRVEPGSLRARLDGAEVALPDAADVVALGAPAVGADPSTAAGLVQEIAMTALGDVLGAARARPAAELLDLDPLALECEMRGHPWIVASKGRLGFGASDLLAYAPEAAQPLALGWLAAAPRDRRRSAASTASTTRRSCASRSARRTGRCCASARRPRAWTPTRPRTCRCTPGSGSTACSRCTPARSRAASSSRSARSTHALPAGPVDPHARRRRPPAAPPPQARALDPQHLRLPRPAARPHARRAGADAVVHAPAARPTRSCARPGSCCSARSPA